VLNDTEQVFAIGYFWRIFQQRPVPLAFLPFRPFIHLFRYEIRIVGNRQFENTFVRLFGYREGNGKIFKHGSPHTGLFESLPVTGIAVSFA